MPPVGPALTAAEIATVRTWIDAGAKATAVSLTSVRSTHWSLQPIKRPAVPPVQKDGWTRNPIDAFVLAKLEEKGLKPVADADKRVLIRRLTYDLTGLPPTPEEVEAIRREELRKQEERAQELELERLQAAKRDAGSQVS